MLVDIKMRKTLDSPDLIKAYSNLTEEMISDSFKVVGFFIVCLL